MSPRFLLDTHIVVRCLSEPKRLSSGQRHIMDNVVRRGECVGVSAISLLEIALLEGGRDRLVMGLNDLFHQLETRTTFHIIPLSTDVAREVFSLGSALRDPADRVIVATARVHHLTLLTADQRIIESNLVPVVE